MMSTMFKLAVVTIALFLIQDSHGRVEYNWCPSGVIGPVCSDYDPCKSGYTCIKGIGKCCRDPVCPMGWLEGGSCNLFPGQAKCKEGYQCMDNKFCCRSTFCPSGSIGPKCVDSSQCKSGYTCRGGNCCVYPVCPNGWTEGGVCNLKHGEPRCGHGFDCNNDFCCKRPPLCPSGETGKPCKKGRCEYGFTCTKGYCCRNI